MTNPRGKVQGGPAEPSGLPETVKPPFDPQQFARDTESKIRLESEQPPSARPTLAPPSPLPLPHTSATDVPVLAITRDDLEWFALSPLGRTLLQQVNGRDTVEALAGLLRRTPEELLTELDALARDGLITWR